MKFLKIFSLVIVGLLLLVLIGGFIFLKTFDIKKYKSQIISSVDKALGRHLDFNDIELKVSLKEGIRFHMTDVRLSEHPDFGKDDFAKIKEVYVGVDVLSFLNARQVSIPNILVKSPEIVVIRNAQGKLNVQTLAPSTSTEGVSQSSTSSAQSAAAIPAIFINSLRIEGAKMVFYDESVTPRVEVSVSLLDFAVDHFSLNKPFNFVLEAAVLTPQRNVKIGGNVDLNVLAKSVRLSNLGVWVDLGQLPLETLHRLPELKAVPLPEVLQGQIQVDVKECTLSEKGLGTIVLDAQLNDGKVYLKDAAPGIPVDLSQINFSVKDFSLGRPFDFSLTAAFMHNASNVDVKGNVFVDLNTQSVALKNLTVNTDLKNWPLAKMKTELLPLKDVPLPEHLAGGLKVTIKDLAAGAKGLKHILADVELNNAEVRMNNIAPDVNFAATQINLSLKDFALGKPFQLLFQMAYLNNSPNVKLQGSVMVDDKTQSVQLSDFNAQVDLGLVSLEELKSSVASLKSVSLPQVLQGKLAVLIKELDASAKGLQNVRMDVNLNEGRVAMADVAPGVSLDAKKINLSLKDFTLDQQFGIELALAYLSDEPNIAFDGRMGLDLSTSQVGLKDGRLKINLSNLNLAELKSTVSSLASVPLPETLAGDLQIVLKELSAGPQGLGALGADVLWNNGSVSVKEIAPGISVAASQIDLELKNVSLEKKPITFQFNAAYLSEKPNIDFSGTALFDMAQSAIELNNAVFKTDLSALSMDQLRSSISSLKEASLPVTLKGLFNVTIDSLAAGPKGLTSLLTHGELTQATIQLKELKLPVDISQLKFQADGTNAKVDDLLVVLGKGTIKAKASIDQYLTKPIIHKEVVIDGLDLTEILEQKDAPVKVQGLIYSTLKIDGDPTQLPTLTGAGTFEMKEGKLKDLNVIKTVFDSIKIPLLPNLSSIVMAALPQEYKTQFEKPDTDLKSVKTTMTIANASARLDLIDVQSDLFMFTGTGTVGFDQAYKIDGSFNVTEGLSALLVKDVENPFAYMRNPDNLVSFPVHVKGKGAEAPVFEVEAILKDVAKNAIQSKGKEELGKFLNKVLNQNGIQTQTTEGTAPADASAEQPLDQSATPTTQEPATKTAGEEIVDGILGTIFK